MTDNLAVIKQVIAEHQIIRENVKLAGDSVNDMEAMFNLQRAYSGWTLTSVEAINEKLNQLLQTVGLLDAGLNNHFAFEEQALPPLFGELLMQALLAEHQQIRQQIDKAKSMLAETQLAKLQPEKLLSEKSHIQQAVNAIGQVLEEHAAREETILNMMEKALEEKA